MNTVLFTDTVPEATEYVLRSLPEDSGTVYLVSSHPVVESKYLKWVSLSQKPPTVLQFKQLWALHAACKEIGTGTARFHLLPTLWLKPAALPISESKVQNLNCPACRNNGLKGLTLRKLQKDGYPYYEYDMGFPFEADVQTLADLIASFEIPYAIETYYNNIFRIPPSDSKGWLVHESWLYGKTPKEIDSEVEQFDLVAFTRYGWNRSVSEWAADKWNTKSKYER